MTAPLPPPGSGADIYGLAAPTLADARTALVAVYGEPDARRIWIELLDRAQMTGAETGEAALERFIQVMRDHHPVTALCGRSLNIRLHSYRRLAAAYDMTGSEK
ncbi:hypothetical protein [Planobispora takensis]|uniref:Uncharacterized protein n=1 Tax=Planobispora takensis TaxID=1367882 RepID=A0A8J3SSS6_9ACTN|nr:hypothetical protein [Planobispora takensis]GIH99866.1 hypothetical protein Pta02_18750 [Planobispora takensis]